MYLKLKFTPYLIPKYIIKITESLDFTVLVFNWPLPDDHVVYKMYRRSFRNVFISPMLKYINDLEVCTELHSVPIEVNEDELCPSTSIDTYRASSSSCDLLTIPSTTLYNGCVKMEKDIITKTKWTTKSANTPAKPNAPTQREFL